MSIDVKISNTEWSNVNILSGIDVGNRMILNNKSVNPILIQVVNEQPSADSTEGILLTGTPEIPDGNETVWMRSTGDVSGIVSIQSSFEVVPFTVSSVEDEDPLPVITKTFLQDNIEKGLQYSFITEMELSGNETKYLSVSTPDNANDIIVTSRNISTDGGMRYTPRAGGSWTSNADPLPILNLNTQSPNVSLASIETVDSENVISEGFAFDIARSADGKGGTVAGGAFSEGGTERVIAKGTDYLLKFENLQNSAIFIIFTLSWFEGEIDLGL